MDTKRGSRRSDAVKGRLDEATRAMREILWGSPRRVSDYFQRLKEGSTEEHAFLVALPGKILSLAEEETVPAEQLREVLERVAHGALPQAADAMAELTGASRNPAP